MKKIIIGGLIFTISSVYAQDFDKNISDKATSDLLTNSIQQINNKVIYGKDDRVEVDQAQANHIKMSKSTAAMVTAYDISLQTDDSNNEYYQLKEETLRASFNVCEDQRFANQPSAANCSGFLVGKNLLVTAGHCVNSEYDCADNVWVFDYKMNSETNQANTKIATNNVYKCKQIINYQYAYGIDNDYALIELDREVEGREVLKLRTEGAIAEGEEIVVIGHPSGLPTKVAGGAKVRSIEPKEYFTANLDTFGGNSGSAVFNAETDLVEGILVRGEQDYEFDMERGCRVVKECKDDECRGEDVTKITEIKELLYIDQLILAVKEDKEEVIDEILAKHFNPDMFNADYKTAMILAVELNKVELVKKLLLAGASFNKNTLKQESALNKAIASKNEQVLTLFAEILDNDSADMKKIIATALSSDMDALLKVLINKGVSTETKIDGNTLLANAIKNKNQKVTAFLLDSTAAQDVLVDGISPLIVKAAANGMNDVIVKLLENGADIDAKSLMLENTAVHEAVENDQLDTLQLLLDKNASVKLKNTLGYTASKLARVLKKKEASKMIKKYKIKNFFESIF